MTIAALCTLLYSAAAATGALTAAVTAVAALVRRPPEGQPLPDWQRKLDRLSPIPVGTLRRKDGENNGNGNHSA